MKDYTHQLPLYDLGFVKIWVALTTEYKGNPVIQRHDLEKKLHSYFGDKEYSEVFKNIVFYNPMDEDPYAELFYGFQLAEIMGIVKRIDQEDYLNSDYEITIDINQANNILSEYDDNILVPMIRLYDQVNSKKRKKLTK